VTATVASGYSTGEAIKAAQEVADQMLPQGYTYDY
jgi:HAE1 family hydrophobic/amphiphilic exporter-1